MLLTLDPKNVNAWINLGASLGVGETAQVGGTSYTQQQCFVHVLTLDPKNVNAWYNLGASLGVGETAQVGSQTYTKEQCCVQALTLDPKDVRVRVGQPWIFLG